MASTRQEWNWVDQTFAAVVVTVLVGLNLWAEHLSGLPGGPQFRYVSFVFLAFMGAFLLMPVLSRAVWSGYDHLDESKKKKSLWLNTMASLLHSAIVSVTSCVAVYQATLPSLDNVLLPTDNPWVLWSFTISLGYMVYDTWHWIETGLWRKGVHILYHHVAVIMTFFLSLLLNCGMRCCVCTLVCEINTVFLHTRTLTTTAGFNYKNSPWYRWIWTFQWLSFFGARVPSHFGLVYFQVRDVFQWGAQFGYILWFIATSMLLLICALDAKLFFDLRKAQRRAIKLAEEKGA